MKSPFPKSVYQRNAQIYKILAHPIRLEILNSIRYEECSVEEIIRALNISKSNVSQHLALLRHARLVKARRQGQNVFYTMTDPRLIEPCTLLKNIWEEQRHARSSTSVNKAVVQA